MAIEPVKIPQNVYIEDRIVGPLTLRQLIITMAGGGFSYMIYGVATRAAGSANIVISIVSWIPLLVAFAFAFIKVNDLSLMKLILLSFERFNNPPVRTWNPRTGLIIKVSTATASKEEKAPVSRLAQAEALSSNARIKELSTVLDRGIGTMEDMTADEDVDVAHDEPHAEEETIRVSTAPQETDKPSASTLPVDRSRFQVDQPQPQGSQLSDLAVFRDIFTPTDRA